MRGGSRGHGLPGWARRGMWRGPSSDFPLEEPLTEAARYRKAQGALYRLATGYKVKIYKHYKETEKLYDAASGKRIREAERYVPREDEVYVSPSVTALVQYLRHCAPEGLGEETAEEKLLRAADLLLGDVMERADRESDEEGDA